MNKSRHHCRQHRRYDCHAHRIVPVSYTHLDVYKRQEHHRPCGAVIPPQEGGGDAERIQHLYFQLAVQQAADPLPDKGDGAPHRICRRDGRGQEHLSLIHI